MPTAGSLQNPSVSTWLNRDVRYDSSTTLRSIWRQLCQSVLKSCCSCSQFPQFKGLTPLYRNPDIRFRSLSTFPWRMCSKATTQSRHALIRENRGLCRSFCYVGRPFAMLIIILTATSFESQSLQRIGGQRTALHCMTQQEVQTEGV